MKYLADYGIAGDHPTSRNAEGVPMAYLFPSPNDPVHGHPTEPSCLIIAEGSGAETQLPIRCVEPLLIRSRILLRDNDSHDGVLVDEDVK